MISTLLIVFMALGPFMDQWNAYGAMEAERPDTAQIGEAISETASLLMKTVENPVISQVGGEWTILGLARSGYAVPSEYYNKYKANVEKELTAKIGMLTSVKYTEYSRLILALTAIGVDVQNVSGYNLLEKIADFDNIKKQGVNGPAFALLALDSYRYEIPAAAAAAVVSEGGTAVSREALINYLLTRGPVEGDVDRTAIMLQALSKYQDRKDVKAFAEKAFKLIDNLENSDGSFSYGGEAASESIVQVITAKTMWGLDCSSNVEALLEYRIHGGGFEHIKGQGLDLMATEQALYAMAAYQRNFQGKTNLYDMTDVKIISIEEQEIKVSLNGRYITFDQPPIIENNRTLVPMRAIFEAFGAQVLWDPDTKTVTGFLDGKIIKLVVNDAMAYVDGVCSTLDAPAKIIGDRTMVPVRFISESLDAQVEWIESPRTVMITK